MGVLQKDVMKRIGTVDQKSDVGELWTDFSQQLQPFSRKLRHNVGHSGDVPSWMVEAGNKTTPHWIGNANHYNRDCCRRVLDRLNDRSRADHDEINLQPDQLVG